MDYFVRYLVQVDRNGRVRPTLYIHTSDESKDENQIWYAYGNWDSSVSLPWDSANGTVASSAAASWSHEIDKVGGRDGTDMIRASFDRTSMRLTLSSGEGTYNSSTHTYSEPSGLFAEPATFDCSAYEWTRGTANTDYAQLNMDADFAAQAVAESGGSGGGSGTLQEVFTTADPVVTGAVQSGAQQITASWTATAAQGSEGNTISPALTLQYSTDGTTWTESGKTLTGLSGSTAVAGLAKAAVYYWRVKAVWSTLNVTRYSNTDKSARTVTPLNAPTGTDGSSYPNASVSAANAVTLTWSRVANNAGYLVAYSADGSSWTTADVAKDTETYTLSDGGGKQFKVLAKAAVASYPLAEGAHSWENGPYSSVRTTEQNQTQETVTYGGARIDFMAIPTVYVDYNSLSDESFLGTDLITKDYADAHYSGQSVSPSQLPTISAYSSATAAGDESHITTPKYVESRLGALNITAVKVSADSGAKTFAGVQLGTGETATGTTTINLVSKKYIEDTYVAKTQKADTSGNAGIVSVSTSNNGNGLKINSSAAGQIEVNWATAAEIVTGTVATKAVNPSVLAGASVKSSSDNAYAANKAQYVRTDGTNGKISNTLLPLATNGAVGAASFDSDYFTVTNGEVTLKSIAVTDTVTVSDAYTFKKNLSSDEATLYSSGTYATRAAAIDALYTAKSSLIQKGDLVIVNPSISGDAWKYTLRGLFVSTGSGLIEISVPDWAVSSVNGYTGEVTQAEMGLVTWLGTNGENISDTKFPSLKLVDDSYAKASHSHPSAQISDAVSTSGDIAVVANAGLLVQAGAVKSYVAGKIKDVTDTFGGAQTCPVAAWTASGANASHWDDSGTDLVNLTYLAAALGDFDEDLNLGAAAGYGVSANGVADGETGLVTGDQVYDYTPLLTRLKWTANQTVAGVYTGDVDAPSSEDYKIASAYAVKKWIDAAADSVEISVTAQYGLTYTNKTLAITRANGTGTYGTVVQSAAANGLTIANGVISPTWASYATTGDRTSTVKFVNPAYVNAYIAANASVSGDAGKLVKFDDNGFIDALSIMTDDTYIYALKNGDDPAYLTINRDAIINGLASQEWATGRFAQSAALAPAWVASGTYAGGDVVSFQGKLYRRTGSGSNPPGLLASGWTEINLGQVSRFDGSITGDGSTTEFTVTHGLGVKDVDVTLIDNATDQEIFAAVTMYSATQVKIGFGAAPASGKKYRVVVRK